MRKEAKEREGVVGHEDGEDDLDDGGGGGTGAIAGNVVLVLAPL